MVEPLDLLFSTLEMSTPFSPEAQVRGMLAFEAALARAAFPEFSPVAARNYTAIQQTQVLQVIQTSLLAH